MASIIIMDKIRVVVIGAGNVATAFVRYILDNGQELELVSLYARRRESATAMEERLGVEFNHTDNIGDLVSDADIYLFCVSDDSLPDVLKSMPATKGIWVHTSGCNHIDVMKPYHDDFAVLYPLQSISKNNIPTNDSISVFLESGTDNAKNIIERFASILFEKISYADSYQRKALHLAAVFACNFTNHMYAISDDILKHFNLPSGALNHLIEYTAQRVMSNRAEDVQTGPAVREDFRTIAIHKDIMCCANPNIVRIYDTVTQSIMEKKKRKDNNYFEK